MVLRGNACNTFQLVFAALRAYFLQKNRIKLTSVRSNQKCSRPVYVGGRYSSYFGRVSDLYLGYNCAHPTWYPASNHNVLLLLLLEIPYNFLLPLLRPTWNLWIRASQTRFFSSAEDAVVFGLTILKDLGDSLRSDIPNGFCIPPCPS